MVIPMPPKKPMGLAETGECAEGTDLMAYLRGEPQPPSRQDMIRDVFARAYVAADGSEYAMGVRDALGWALGELQRPPSV